MNKKGFTLIELLAVILILGIIALIAIPQVTNVIENAHKGAAETSASHYIDATMDKIALNLLDTDSSNDLKDGYHSIEELQANVTGEKPLHGGVYIENGKIQASFFEMNGYNVRCDDKKKCEAAKAEYGYYSKEGLVDETISISDLTFTRPTDKNVYLKLPMKDGEIFAFYATPCLYDNEKEFCLYLSEYELDDSIVKEFAGYNESWTYTGENVGWVNGDNTALCRISEGYWTTCIINSLGATSSSESDAVLTFDWTSNFGCFHKADNNLIGCVNNISTYTGW